MVLKGITLRSKSGGEREIPNNFTYGWNLTKQNK